MSENKENYYQPSSNTDAHSGSLQHRLLNPKNWVRLLLMLLMYVILFVVVKFILFVVLFVQWVLVLFSGEPNARLRHFTKSLNWYGYQIMEFISFNSEQCPFPLSDWPEMGE